MDIYLRKAHITFLGDASKKMKYKICYIYAMMHLQVGIFQPRKKSTRYSKLANIGQHYTKMHNYMCPIVVIAKGRESQQSEMSHHSIP